MRGIVRKIGSLWSMTCAPAVVPGFSRTLLTLHAGLAIALSACGGDGECTKFNYYGYAVRADLSCPSTQEVEEVMQPRIGRDNTIVDMLIENSPGEIRTEPWTVCWYRIEGSPLEFDCAGEESAVTDDSLLSRALRLARVQGTGRDDSWADNTPSSDGRTDYPIACDAEGLLYAHTIVHDVTSQDAALATVPADCPAALTEEQVKAVNVHDPSAANETRQWNAAGERLSGLVGRDFYPARLNCSCKAVVHYACSDSGLGWPIGPH